MDDSARIYEQWPLSLEIAMTPVTAPPPSAPPPSAPAPSTPTYLLPASIDTTDPLLFAEIHRTIKSSNYLLTRERRVLRAVLLNMPSNGDNSLLRRMLSLDSIQFGLLARVFEEGLLAARNFGGRPSNQPTPADSDDYYIGSAGSAGSKRLSVDDDTDDCDDLNFSSAKRPRVESQDPRISAPMSPAVPSTSASPSPAPEPAPTNTMGPPPSRVQLLFQALGVPHTLPDANRSDRFARRGSLQDACLARQNRTCPITGRGADMFKLETAHLVPHSIAAMSAVDDAPYWRLLNLCIGPTLTNQIFEIVGGANSFRSSNGLTMDPILHGSLFDRGLFWLLPHLPTNFSAATSHHYDVELVWRADLRSLRSIMTFLPRDPAAQLSRSGHINLLDDARRIDARDRFRLFTRDPDRYPLPHPLLLSLHAVIWEMIAASGLLETARSRTADTSVPVTESRRRRSSTMRARGRTHGSQRPRNGGELDAPPFTPHPPQSGSRAPGAMQEAPLPSSVASGSARTASAKSASSASSLDEKDPTPGLDVEYVDFKLAMHAAEEVDSYLSEDEYGSDQYESEENAEGEDCYRRGVSPGLLCEYETFKRVMHRREMQAMEREGRSVV